MKLEREKSKIGEHYCCLRWEKGEELAKIDTVVWDDHTVTVEMRKSDKQKAKDNRRG